MRAGEALSAAPIAARDARLLLARALGASEASLIAHPERVLSESVARRFADWVTRRARGEPVAYLLGEREFYGLALEVCASVLIPRPETELLVEAALERLAPQAAPAVLDLGTGSGAIALALRSRLPQAHIVAVDSSPQALAVAARNAGRLGLAVELRAGHWFAPVAGERFDLVVSNPPYLAEGDPHLGRGDLRFEPRAALAAGADGLTALREILAGAPAHLRPGGWLLLEHGIGQDGAVQALAARAGFALRESLLDLSGIARVLAARVKS